MSCSVCTMYFDLALLYFIYSNFIFIHKLIFRPGWKNVLSVSFSTTLFIVCWQFAQFMLFTQTCAVFAVYLLGVLPLDSMHSILVAQVGSCYLRERGIQKNFGKIFYYVSIHAKHVGKIWGRGFEKTFFSMVFWQ